MTHSADGSAGPAPARGDAPLALAIGAAFLARAVAAGTVESLRAELWLTDQALGTLASAFGGAYAVALPAGAILARPGRRMRLLAAGLAVCALATAASALANGFPWLAFGRSAAGAGAGLGAGATAGLLVRAEPRSPGGWSGLVPAAAGIALGYLVGGLCSHPALAHFFGWVPGWRGGFVVGGAAVLAIAVALRRSAEPADDQADPWEAVRRGGLRAAVAELGADRRRALGLAAALVGAAGLSAVGFWVPAFLVRLQTTPADVAGGELAAAVLAAAIAGSALARAALRALASEQAPRWLAAAGGAIAAVALAAALAWRGAPVLVLAALMVAFTAAFAAAYCGIAVIVGRDAPAPAALALVALLVHGIGEPAGPIALGAFGDRASLAQALLLLPALLLASAVLWAASAWAGLARARAAQDSGRHLA